MWWCKSGSPTSDRTTDAKFTASKTIVTVLTVVAEHTAACPIIPMFIMRAGVPGAWTVRVLQNANGCVLVVLIIVTLVDSSGAAGAVREASGAES